MVWNGFDGEWYRWYGDGYYLLLGQVWFDDGWYAEPALQIDHTCCWPRWDEHQRGWRWICGIVLCFFFNIFFFRYSNMSMSMSMYLCSCVYLMCICKAMYIYLWKTNVSKIPNLLICRPFLVGSSRLVLQKSTKNHFAICTFSIRFSGGTGLYMYLDWTPLINSNKRHFSFKILLFVWGNIK